MVRRGWYDDDRDTSTSAHGATLMSTTALILVGLLLVLLAIPLAFSLGPIAIGAFLLVLGYRRANHALVAAA